MVDESSRKTSLFSELKALGRAVVDLVRGVKEGTRSAEAASGDQPIAQLALPIPEQHFENPQLLTQHTPGWHTPNPSTLASPSYAPAMTAFAIVFVALGAVTKWPLSIVGALIFVVAIAKWIGELLHD